MSSPPLRSTPLASRLARLAAEVRAENADAGMIATALVEVFARLLTCLAGFAARLEGGTKRRPEPRATTAPIAAAAPVAPGHLSRVFGWLGGLLPVNGWVALPPDVPRPGAEPPRARNASPHVDAEPRAGTSADRWADRWADTPPGHTDAEAAWSAAGEEWVDVSPCPVAAPASMPVRTATWRRLPASTAGPFGQSADFP